MKILVTGGAGFIGSHLVDALLAANHDVRVLDNLEPQVHQQSTTPPAYLNPSVEFIKGDVRHYEVLQAAMDGCEAVYHLAARVGVGQSMYEVRDYIDSNVRGTANILDILVKKDCQKPKLIVASSNTVYGEGQYACQEDGLVQPRPRPLAQLEKKAWEVKCPTCGKALLPQPTPETMASNATSIYAQSKQYAEEMSLLVGKTYDISITVLRFFCAYGPRQSLSNPYTGVFAIFASNLLAGNPPLIYEDGKQTRDFVHVDDICQGLTLALENPAAKNEVFNVGTGRPTPISKVASLMVDKINPTIQPRVVNKYRKGDIRHCFADISKIQRMLGYSPRVKLEEGLDDFITWAEKEKDRARDHSSTANKELKRHGLL